eukprot:EG_transcript_16182
MSCYFGCGTIRGSQNSGSACPNNRLHLYQNGFCVQCGMTPHNADCKFGRHNFPPLFSPYVAFLNLLPEGTTIDEGIMEVLMGPLSSLLNGVATKDDAVALLQRAATHIRDTTVKVVAAKENIIINSKFQIAAEGSKSNLFLAYDIQNDLPVVVKFGADVKKEKAIFDAFGSDQAAVRSKGLVPLRLINLKPENENEEKVALVMPAYQCSFESMLWAPEPVLRKVIDQIGEALKFMHSKSIFHNDVKSLNILMSSSGAFALCDYGACLHEKGQEILQCTPAYIPKGLPRKSGPHFDKVLLAVSLVMNRDFLCFVPQRIVYQHKKMQFPPKSRKITKNHE